MNNEQLVDFALKTAINTEVPTVVFNPKKQIIFANEPFATGLGYTVDELLHLSHSDLCFATYTQSPEYQTFWDTILSGKQFQEQILRRAKDGHKVFFEAIYSPIIDANGKVVAIVKIAFNTTKRAETLGEVLVNIRDFTNKVDALAHDGVDHIGSTLDGVNKTQDFATKNKETSTTLLHETEQANDIITVIQDVAHQTRMLAINSAIEAARLNENGGSFTVISKEIRNLSNQVREEAINIQDRISKIENQVRLLANEAKQIHSLNADSVDKLSVTLASYEELQTGAERITKVYATIGHLLDEQDV